MSWGRSLLVIGVALALVGGCAGQPATSRPPGSSDGPVVDLVVFTDRGNDLHFVPDELIAPANAHVRITFRNVSTQPHNLTFEGNLNAATRTIVEAGGSDVVDVTTPGPGRYRFVCTIHMEMTATLVVR